MYHALCYDIVKQIQCVCKLNVIGNIDFWENSELMFLHNTLRHISFYEYNIQVQNYIQELRYHFHKRMYYTHCSPCYSIFEKFCLYIGFHENMQ